MLPVFVADFFRGTVPPFLTFFQSSICLSFFGRRVFGEELWVRGSGMCLEIFPFKKPPFSPKNPAIKSSPFLSF